MLHGLVLVDFHGAPYANHNTPVLFAAGFHGTGAVWAPLSRCFSWLIAQVLNQQRRVKCQCSAYFYAVTPMLCNARLAW